MNTGIVSIDHAAITELLDKTIHATEIEAEIILSETSLPKPVNKIFGAVDLWKIRGMKRNFIFYK